MACGTGALNCLVIVLSCKEVKIPYLWLSWHEHLDSTCKKHLLIVLAESTVVGSINLIIHVLLAVKILYETASSHDGIDKVLDLLLGKKSLKVKKRDSVMAAQHVDCADLVINDLQCPTGEILAALLLHGVDKETRKEEVISHVAHVGNLLVNLLAVACMNLGKKCHMILVGKLANL